MCPLKHTTHYSFLLWTQNAVFDTKVCAERKKRETDNKQQQIIRREERTRRKRCKGKRIRLSPVFESKRFRAFLIREKKKKINWQLCKYVNYAVGVCICICNIHRTYMHVCLHTYVMHVHICGHLVGRKKMSRS